MLIEHAELLTAHGQELAVREKYSGRGMFGNSTAAVEFRDIADLVASAAAAMQNLCGRPDSDGDQEAFIQAMDALRIDSLGRGYIAY